MPHSRPAYPPEFRRKLIELVASGRGPAGHIDSIGSRNHFAHRNAEHHHGDRGVSSLLLGRDHQHAAAEWRNGFAVRIQDRDRIDQDNGGSARSLERRSGQ